jgi:hypothetical protein
VCFLVVGCSSHIDKDDLAGRYILNTGPGKDTLELKGDWTYFHTYEADGKSEVSKADQWELEDIEGAKTVTLHNFEPLPGEPTKGRGFYLLSVRRSFGSIHLMTDADLNLYYEKQRE